MRHHIFEESNSYAIAILIKSSCFIKQELVNSYVAPLSEQGITIKDVIAFTLSYNDQDKATAAHCKEYLTKLLPALVSLGVKHLYVADAAYFKVLTGQAKADPHFGYVLPCKIKGYEHLSVVLGLNYRQLIFNPDLQPKLNSSLIALTSSMTGGYIAPGTGIIHSAEYPESLQDIAAALQKLLSYPELSCDIEGFSLAFDQAGIGTIAFAWSQHEGIAFACDYATSHDEFYGLKRVNPEVRALLRDFFVSYNGELTFHNATYDIKAIICALWMKDLLDTPMMLHGLDLMTKCFHDTKVIAYLAVNSTAGNVLGLKSLAHEFAGNWAKEDIKDIRKIPLAELLQYNLVDALCTHYVKAKYYPVMQADQQEALYKELMLPSLKMIIQVELTGMPLNPHKVQEVKAKLEAIQADHLSVITSSKVVYQLNVLLRNDAQAAANAKLKVKQHPLDKFDAVMFNPNSGLQLQKLLYGRMNLPVLDTTDTGQPSTGADTIEKLINHTDDSTYKELLAALIGHGKVSKILSTFIPAFEKALDKGDGIAWLHGSFNLGGTVSGRLSSSDPNLQNIPAGSTYAKLIKECFQAPLGWLMCGADFNSLEDMISALTTRDPNKLAVYERGFDGHSLRAAYYFREQCPEIDLNDSVSVNTIKKKYPQLRQDSKAPTFLLTYGGTHHGMMSNLGWDKEKSQAIEKGYHDLYQVSDQYIQDRLHQAAKDGYVEVAFGLRVRTPLLKQVLFGSSKMPYEAAAEGRTAGNAMGQSYGLLNNRAAVDFMQKVWVSKYRYCIKPVALIHDAIYILIKDDAETVLWANQELIKSMQWQDLPEIQHPTVKLGAALDIFWPNWAHATTVPNNADLATLVELCKATKEEHALA